MIGEIVLNPHSLPFANKEDANEGLSVFLNVLKACRYYGLKILLIDEYQDKSLMGLELSSGYFVRDWYASSNNSIELVDHRRLLKSLETRQPLFETLEHIDTMNHYEVGLAGENSGKPVLLATFFFDIFLLSFTALSAWRKTHIEVWVLELGANPETRNETILNIFDESSLETHKEELVQRRNALLNTAKDIWVQRTELFPHLELLQNQIGGALQNWSARRDILLGARDALNVLERLGEKWDEGEYSEYRHQYLKDLGLSAEVSGESESVNKNPEKRKKRFFWLEDGQKVYFENHVKLPNGYRLHFYPDIEQKRIYVAYLGPHLPT